eukprot:CAMPEP_0197074826 /NCGR_PEP_ID=MMETSP1384-20130603/211301_1 /TAXON_ID=29189 /ORGANISM="Ammonia sp." /LENGTH=447 /DNA_ID=CAMNT_0042513667 /DNA_START=62 /DNA_END=1405 /DNA_ORIENTATION=+
MSNVEKICDDESKEMKQDNEQLYKNESGVEYKLNKSGSLTFYPTPDIKRGQKLFETRKFAKHGWKAAFDWDKQLVSNGVTSNSFINCCEKAYGQHYPLLLKPEHIFYLILHGICKHVDKNAEKLRTKFVNHADGKIKLTVKHDAYAFGPENSKNADWNAIIEQFVSMIDKNSKQDVAQLFDSNFSTSTLTEKIAAKITLMATVKHYFEYEMMACVCGFPEITLDGTVEDWILLRQKVQTLLSSKCDKRFGEKWAKSLLPVLDRFVAAFKGDISMVFWNSMIWRGQWAYMKGSGAYGMGAKTKQYKQFLSGWINVFFPFVGSKEDYENEWCFKPYEGDNHSDQQYKGKQIESTELAKEYGRRGSAAKKDTDDVWSKLGPSPGDFTESMCNAPVKWDYLGKIIPLKFNAGIVGYEQNEKTLQLTPTIGWFIDEDRGEQLKQRRGPYGWD